MNKRLGGYVVLVAVISLLFAGCGRDHGDDVDLSAASSVTVKADKEFALANSSEDITLTAEVKNVDGTLLSGKAISFVITAGTGSLHTADAATNASGVASVKLRRDPIAPPNTIEDVTVTATVDTATGTKTVRFLNLTVTLTSDKETALANGSEDITLTALVKNANGTLLPGKTISFVITAGTGSLHNADAATNASGVASVKLRRDPIASPNTSEDVTVTATVDTASGTKTVRFVNLIILMTADKEIALANGNDPVSPERITLTAHVNDANGTAISGQTISFAVTAGTGSLINADTVTNASGTATVMLQRDPIPSPNTREDVTVTATADSASGIKTVRFINQPSSAAIEIALNRVITDLAILTFDLVSSPTVSKPLLLEVTPIGLATTAPFIGPLGPGTQNTYAFGLGDTTYSLVTSVVPGITTTVNGTLVGFTFSVDQSLTSLPTFTVLTQPSYFPALTSAGYPVLPEVTKVDFVETTIFDTDK